MTDTFLQLYGSLPRQAPGSNATTRHLYGLAGNPTGKALDIGCGQGRASLLLAEYGLDVTAVDIYQPFLDALQAEAEARNLGAKVTAHTMSMDTLHFPAGSFDLLWAEGSAYILGWGNALAAWREFLAPTGVLVATECCWLADESSGEVKQFWHENYPSMLTIGEAKDIAAKSGYEVTATYVLPSDDWRDEYYTPLRAQCAMHENGASDAMRTAIAAARREIEMYENYGDQYGYVGFVLRRVG